MGGDVLEHAELAVGLEADVLKGVRNNHALLEVVGVRDTVEALEVVHGLGALSGLVRNHTADAAHHDLVGGALVEGALLGVVGGLLGLEGAVFELVAVQRSGDVGVLAANLFLLRCKNKNSKEISHQDSNAVR